MSRLDEQGFSILELLVAAILATVFALSAWGFQRAQGRELSNQAASIDATDRLRSAMTFLSREIRQAGYDPRLTALVTAGGKGIREAGARALWIEWDANENGTIDATATDPLPESVLYAYDTGGQRILRTIDGVGETLVGNVPEGGFELEYFDVSGNPLPFTETIAVATGAGGVTVTTPALGAAQRDLVAFVRLRLRMTALTTTPSTLGLSSRVTVRNRVLDRL